MVLGLSLVMAEIREGEAGQGGIEISRTPGLNLCLNYSTTAFTWFKH